MTGVVGYEVVKDGWDVLAPATPEAAQWEGWGTALKPANEPIVLARKPLSEKTVAANVLRWGTGAINVGACRVAGEKPDTTRGASSKASSMVGTLGAQGRILDNGSGRWPANVLHDGSEEVVGAFPDAGGGYGKRGAGGQNGIYSPIGGTMQTVGFGDSGSAARFFYAAKADKDDRLGSRHPTVKPVDLMAYLCRLVTPPGGTVLDPFAGSGSTGMACMREGFRCILIERETEYVADIENRIKHVSGENAPLFAGVATLTCGEQ